MLCIAEKGGAASVVPDEVCEGDKPPTEQECEGQECDGVWFTAPWGRVSGLFEVSYSISCLL